MPRVLVLLCLCALAPAAEDYGQMLAEARRALLDGSLPWGERFDRQYEKLAEAALAEPSRWEAFFERGENRCNRAFFHRAEMEMYLARARVAGVDEETVRREQQLAERQIEQWRLEAHREFTIAESVMRRRGQVDAERLLFANAAMKFAGREYLRALRGERGAIDDFKELVRRDFLPEKCSDHIALCYVDVGHGYYLEHRFEDAQRAWDEGLKWARQPYLRQMLWTNKAGAYEMDHQYALAEEVLLRQIEGDRLDPAHHKNLGLVLGYQNRLKEALVHYGKARELCGGPKGGLAMLHGNAWLRAAVIHGTLLERDGDMLLAWRLFLEYRRLFGDDYNFSLWFGDFASAHGAYDLAWRYLEHARDLQPRCQPAYQKLTQIAPRTGGTREEVEARMEAATRALFDAQARYYDADESAAVLKICGGVADLADIGIRTLEARILDPDPLAGFDEENPPPWVARAAETRDPFVPVEPEKPPEPREPAARAPEGSAWPAIGVGAAAILLLGTAALLFLFRRPRA